MTDQELLSMECAALVRLGYDKKLESTKKLGKEMFKFETQFGFPKEMFLEELENIIELDIDQEIIIISHYQSLMMNHKIKSGGFKNIEKEQKDNREFMKEFILKNDKKN